jgi:hypothetical protein
LHPSISLLAALAIAAIDNVHYTHEIAYNAA